MNYVSVENLSKMYGDKLLFESLSFGINKNDRVALVAQNGTGKTSLLKIIAGKDESDSGMVVTRNGISIGYLPQEADFTTEKSIIDTVFASDTELFDTVKQYEKALEKDDFAALEGLMEAMDRLDAWNLEQRVHQVLDKLGLTNLGQSVKQLSGGQKKRIALAKVLIEDPDVFVLDEPTNHLDIQMINWLESYLNSANTTVFMVTHDRHFLDSVTNKIIELDRGEFHLYKGNYQYFVEKRIERIQNATTARSKAQSLLKKELDWYRRQPKARTTKAKSRIDSIDTIKEAASVKIGTKAAKITSLSHRLGSKILELHNASKHYGENILFKNFYYKFGKNDRVGLVGPNGCGKTTLIKILLGQTNTDTGKIVFGETLKIAHYSQAGLQADNDMRVIEVVKKIAEVFALQKGKSISAAQMLERFLFPREMHYQRVDKLSGGERKRLHLVQVLMEQPNFLILDEPTNDLDLLTINVLEDFLANFQGCIVIASHDRHFLDKTVKHLFVFNKNREISDFPGNYSDYAAVKASEIKTSDKENKKKLSEAKPKSDKPKVRLSFNEQREFDEIEAVLPMLEKERGVLEAALNEGTLPYEELNKRIRRLSEVVNEIEEKEMRWLELSEYA